MHVQVTTRFIASSCPVIYWYVASLTTTQAQLNPAPQQSRPHHRHSHQNGDAHPDNIGEPEIHDEILDWDSKSNINKVVFVYFHLYFFVGIGAFSNFLPWT